MPLKLFLHSCAEAITLLPHLQLSLEVAKSLPDELRIAKARHAILSLAERFKFCLNHIEIEGADLSVAALRRTIASRAITKARSLSLTSESTEASFIDVDVEPFVAVLSCCVEFANFDRVH